MAKNKSSNGKAISLSELKGKTRTIEIDVDGDDVYVEIRPYAVSLVDSVTGQDIGALTEDEEGALKLGEELATSISSWGFYEEEEGDFPPSAKNIIRLPDSIIIDIIRAIRTGGNKTDEASVGEAEGSFAAS